MSKSMAFRSRPLALLALPLLAASLLPSSMALAANPPERVIALVVYGDDPCPAADPGKEDEIIVCARKPEAERYRIPKSLREKPEPVGAAGWASQVAEQQEAGQAMSPGSCSPNGSYGFTGCTAALLRQWYAEKRMRESAGVP